jgi:small GTP-binding protein
LLLGDEGTGKSEFTKRYCYNIFNPAERLTIGVDFHVKTIELDNTKIKLQLWDVGGEERFRFLLPTYCLGANGAFLLYNVSRPSTLDNVAEWTNIVRQKQGSIPIMLVGSQLHSDDHRVVSRQEGISIAEHNNLASFVEVCPQENINVNEAFKVLTELILEKCESQKSPIPTPMPTTSTPMPRTPMPAPLIDELFKTIFGEFRPIKIQPEFKINDYLELRFEANKTNIYVGGELFNQCKYLLLKMPTEKSKNLEEIDSIDQAAENLDNSMERGSNYSISPKAEYWGHCSNLQAWYENNYDTRILHRNLAFPLLKALADGGDDLAKRVFKEEIALRLESGYPSVVLYLIDQGYLKYLTKEEIQTIIKNPTFLRNVPKFYSVDIPKWFKDKIKSILYNFKCLYCGVKIPGAIITKSLSANSAMLIHLMKINENKFFFQELD